MTYNSISLYKGNGIKLTLAKDQNDICMLCMDIKNLDADGVTKMVQFGASLHKRNPPPHGAQEIFDIVDRMQGREPHSYNELPPHPEAKQPILIHVIAYMRDGKINEFRNTYKNKKLDDFVINEPFFGRAIFLDTTKGQEDRGAFIQAVKKSGVLSAYDKKTAEGLIKIIEKFHDITIHGSIAMDEVLGDDRQNYDRKITPAQFAKAFDKVKSLSVITSLSVPNPTAKGGRSIGGSARPGRDDDN